MRILGFGLLLWLCSSLAWAAAKDQKTASFLLMAREALALGEMQQWQRAIERMEQAFLSERGAMEPEKQQMYRLWLWMMWSKFYQYKGKLPPVRDIGTFESPSHFDAHTQSYAVAVEALQKAHAYLKRYNLLYQQMAEQSNIRGQLQLQASLSLERDLEGTIQSAKIYIALLRFAKQNQKDMRLLQARLAKSMGAIQRLKAVQEDAAQNKRQIKKTQKKLSLIFQRVEGAYLQFEQERVARQSGSRALLISGAVVAGVGLLSIIGGIVIQVDIQNLQKDATNRPLFSPSAGFCSLPYTDPLTPSGCYKEGDWKGILENVSYGLFGGGGGLMLVGGALLVAGLVGGPSKQDRSNSVLRSQDIYLRTLKPETEDKTSRCVPSQSTPRMCGLLLEVR